MTLNEYGDCNTCPSAKPSRNKMSEQTQALHNAVDENIRQRGRAYLHPESPTLMCDLLQSQNVVSWQENKGEALFLEETCWSELSPLYARYGTHATFALIQYLKRLYDARAALVTDSGMQAVAVAFDALLEPGDHAITLRQVYNKSKTYLDRLMSRIGGTLTIVDDGNLEQLEASIQENSRLIFCETFTNPLMRAQDPEALGRLVLSKRALAKRLALIVDDTIASPWGLKRPLLSYDGIDIVVGAGTKSLGGQDRDMFGYIASHDIGFSNAAMDLLALRGGILDWRRAEAVLAGFESAEINHRKRVQNAKAISHFLSSHPKVLQVFHPSTKDYIDREIFEKHYDLSGTIVSFRLRDADEPTTKHFTDVLASSGVIRYALSFDGLVTKVNHHPTVSEYFTPKDVLTRSGIDRVVRLAVGTEAPEDIIACLNWALHHHPTITPGVLNEWLGTRRQELGLPDDDPAKSL